MSMEVREGTLFNVGRRDCACITTTRKQRGQHGVVHACTHLQLAKGATASCMHVQSPVGQAGSASRMHASIMHCCRRKPMYLALAAGSHRLEKALLALHRIVFLREEILLNTMHFHQVTEQAYVHAL